ncbi:MAG: hypothetical protein HUU46_21255 [Candidatus Hydrogenedentes bacterium]|nr:hypothetical protein [Candidatus Hydrogenedentota bacterium]
MSNTEQVRRSRSVVPLSMGIGAATVVVVAIVLSVQRADAVHVRGTCHCREFVAPAVARFLDYAAATSPLRLSSESGMLTVDYKIESQNKMTAANDLVNAIYPDGKVDDSRFLYLGYMLEDEADGRTLASYYSAKMAKGEPLEDVIPLAKSRSDGRNALLRVQSLKDLPPGGAWNNWYRDPSRIPVFIERPEVHSGKGQHVIFLDGRAMYYPYARGNVWPLERGMMRSLSQMDESGPDTNR